jgi:quercetin dioxygenase-like cupin family protein
MNKLFLILSIFFASFTSAIAAPGKVAYEGIQATPINVVGNGKTIIGQPYALPATNQDLKPFNVTIGAGKSTDIHKHPVPALVYVVSGELEINYGSKGKRVVKTGESYVEAINWCHQGSSYGSKPVNVLVFYFNTAGKDLADSSKCSKLE